VVAEQGEVTEQLTYKTDHRWTYQMDTASPVMQLRQFGMQYIYTTRYSYWWQRH
jgi:hypothetical protein